MGQCHQLFIIIRTVGRYRCLTAVHSRWLYGFSAMKTCLHALNLIQNKANSSCI